MEHQEKTINMLAQERTLFAAERTYAAWLRTAIAAMASGVAILRLISFKTDLHRIVAHIIGETLILWGCMLVVISIMDYKDIRDTLASVKTYKSSRIGLILITVPLLIISLLLAWIVWQ